MDIGENLRKLKSEIPSQVKLVAVSKTKPPEIILNAYNSGHKIFGENKVQDLCEKYEILPKDIEWHFIGHLQSNKVKYLVPFVSLIHGVDSFKLLKVINKEGIKNNRVINCLLQFHIASEQTKFGLKEDEAMIMLESSEYRLLNNIRICGVMGMATFTDDMNQVKQEFRILKRIFENIKSKYFSGSNQFKEISMGMSDDYPVAIEEGSTMVRVGSKIFGVRNY